MSQAINITRRRALIQIMAGMLAGGILGWFIHNKYIPPGKMVTFDISFRENATPEEIDRLYRAAKEMSESTLSLKDSPKYRTAHAVAYIGFFSVLAGMIGAYALLLRNPPKRAIA